MPCCHTAAEARAHVLQYVDAGMLPSGNGNLVPPIEYNGALYAVIEPMGHGGSFIFSDLIPEDSISVLAPMHMDYDESVYYARFQWVTVRWMLVAIFSE